MKEKFNKFAQDMHIEPFRTMWILMMGILIGFLLTLIIV